MTNTDDPSRPSRSTTATETETGSCGLRPIDTESEGRPFSPDQRTSTSTSTSFVNPDDNAQPTDRFFQNLWDILYNPSFQYNPDSAQEAARPDSNIVTDTDNPDGHQPVVPPDSNSTLEPAEVQLNLPVHLQTLLHTILQLHLQTHVNDYIEDNNLPWLQEAPASSSSNSLGLSEPRNTTSPTSGSQLSPAALRRQQLDTSLLDILGYQQYIAGQSQASHRRRPRTNPLRLAINHLEKLSRKIDLRILAASPQSPLNPKRLPKLKAAMASASVKPVACGGGVNVSIKLAEPHLFLAGFDHHGRRRGRRSDAGSAFLRGSLRLEVTKPVKVRAISLRLTGQGRIDWPGACVTVDGRRKDHEYLQSLEQELKFFDVVVTDWDTEWGTACTYTPPSDSVLGAHSFGHFQRPHRHSMILADSVSSSSGSASGSGSGSSHNHSHLLRPRDLRRVSIISTVHHSRSRSVDRNHRKSASVAEVHRDYKRFLPGTYEYSFEIPVDYRYCETVNLPEGYLNWMLTADISRPGPFKPNIHGSREVSIVRIPDMMSVEVSEPVAIRKMWDNQLFYEMVLSGRTFPIGSQLPLMIRLQPLDKRVQLLKLRVYISESIEYISKYHDPETQQPVRRKDARRMFLAFEKLAGHPVDEKRFPGSSLTYRRGGEVTDPDLRLAHRAAAQTRGTLPRDYDARNHRSHISNILGELDLGIEELWEDTEMDINVQIPTCKMMDARPEITVHPEVSWTRFNVQHWIRVVLRVAKRNSVAPGCAKNQYEITIESPIMLTNCRNNEMSLPEYTRANDPVDTRPTRTCGCHDADVTLSEAVPPAIPGLTAKTTVVSSVAPIGPDNTDAPLPDDTSVRRILSRAPSYRPRAFADLTIDTSGVARPLDDDIPSTNPNPNPSRNPGTPSLPPRYDVVVGTPSVDGLADYFSRLQHHDQSTLPASVQEYDSDDSGETTESQRLVDRGGRVNVRNPMSPTLLRAPSRSLDIHRPPLQTILGNR